MTSMTSSVERTDLDFKISVALMYIAPGQGQTAPRVQKFDVNRKALSLYPFIASFKEISFKKVWFNAIFFMI